MVISRLYDTFFFFFHFILDFVYLLRVMCVYLHIYEFILLLYIIYFLSQVSEMSFVCKGEWHLKLDVLLGILFNMILTLY